METGEFRRRESYHRTMKRSIRLRKAIEMSELEIPSMDDPDVIDFQKNLRASIITVGKTHVNDKEIKAPEFKTWLDGFQGKSFYFISFLSV